MARRRRRQTTALRLSSKTRPDAVPGYDVRDTNGMVWSVKLGPEAQPEVVASHLLWSIGFHQPPTLLREGLDTHRGSARSDGTPARRPLPTRGSRLEGDRRVEMG